MEKMTKRNVYTALINFAETGVMSFDTEADGIVHVTADTLKAFAEHEIELLDNKALKAKASAAKRKAEVNPLQAAVKEVLTDEFQTIADITAQIEDEDVTVSKVTYQLNQLVNAGVAEKQPVKVAGADGKKARTVQGYKLIEAEQATEGDVE